MKAVADAPAGMAEEALVAANVARFAAHYVAPHRPYYLDAPSVAPPEGLREALAALGLFELELGDPMTGSVLRELSRHDAGLACAALAHLVGRELGGDGAAAHTVAYPVYDEPDHPECGVRVEERAGACLLDGVVELVVNAPWATALVVPVRREGGLLHACVRREAPGVRVGAPLRTLGLRAGTAADVWLDRVEVSADDLVRGGAAVASPPAGAVRAVLGILAGVVGASHETAARYARDREQGGRAIAWHDAVAVYLGRMAGAEALLAALARAPAFEDGQGGLRVLTEAKTLAVSAASAGVQVLGGYGYVEAFPQEGRLRDARQAKVLLGRPDVGWLGGAPSGELGGLTP